MPRWQTWPANTSIRGEVTGPTSSTKLWRRHKSRIPANSLV